MQDPLASLNLLFGTRTKEDIALSECVEKLKALLQDSQKQVEFIEEAKKVWKKFRAIKGKVRRGRPSEWNRVWAEIAGWYLSNKRDSLLSRASDYQLIKHVHSTLPKLHEDTIRKYVKHWRLFHTPLPDRSESEWRWLAKHDPAEIRSALEILKEQLRDANPYYLQPKEARATHRKITRALQSR